MYPIFAEFESLDFRLASYGTMLALAILASLGLASLSCKREGLRPRDVFSALLLMGLAMFLGMKLHYALSHSTGGGLRIDDLLRIWHGGVHAPGGFLLMIACTPFILRWQGLPIARTADAIAPAVGVGMAIARVGCFLSGCCYGRLCSRLWAVSLPAGSHAFQHHVQEGLIESAATASLPVHPTQLYFALEGLLLTAIALAVRPRRRYEGQVALAFLLAYALARCVLEPLRGAPSGHAILGYPQLQFMGMMMAAIFGAALLWLEGWRRHAL